MRVLLTGATGLIGGALLRALLQAGHEVACAVRDPSRLPVHDCTAVQVDLAAVPDAAWWTPRLQGIDAVVNAVGILREQGTQTFDALHHRAPAELFRAAAAAGVPCAVQVSAVGADDGRMPYQASKRAADDVLRSLPLAGAIVQPSLVFSPQGPSSALFLQLASMPLLLFPLRAGMQVQPVHLDDVVAGVLTLLADPPRRIETIAFVGPRPLPLREYLSTLRLQEGLGRGPLVLPMPAGLFKLGAAIAGHVPGSSLDPDTASMLLKGNAAPADRFVRLLGREPRDVDSFIAPSQAPAARAQAVLGWTLPLLRIGLALLWLWTAAVSFGLYPVARSYELLARVGLHGALATVALHGAATLDLLLGVLTLWAPARWRPAVWLAQLGLIAGYTLLITVFLPEYWLHPYGPMSKNLPIIAAITLLWALEPRRH
ncbi:SDR family oxidoreductase [Ramlibacter algicola]|uniref:SDR family oxidoreductase n=1 Tax=Ramlibacter algicola TaxID=2795217 RepID=A0A934URU0_9BURK|nr:SDR family oxidoreductase [Ramlibacter algicola]MBK0394119.1 SDR family oxidoreductase [Ramlibacter algicola]